MGERTTIRRISVFMRRSIIAAAIAAQVAAFSASIVWAGSPPNMTVKILAVNDFHGQLSPLTDDTGQQVGGAAYLTAYLKKAQAGREDVTIIVDAGDHVGASPANSALLMDEPSIMFLNTLANQYCLADKMDRRCNIVGILGNHEFDKGIAELRRKMDGGKSQDLPKERLKSQYMKVPYPGARYPIVCANVVAASSGKTLVSPYVIKNVRDVPIAFIGAVLKGTKKIVMPAFVAGLEFKDEAEAINSYIPEIKAKGVHAIVAVIHQGDQNGQDPTMADIVKRLDPAVDVVISAHTHKGYARMLQNSAGKDVLVTQAWSYSTAIADITMEIDPATKEVTANGRISLR
jgi:5'-nucleotidase